MSKSIYPTSASMLKPLERWVSSLYFFFFFFFKLYITVLVLPNIKMNPPQVLQSIHKFTAHGIVCCLVTKSCLTLSRPHGLQTARLPCPWDFPSKNTGVRCHFLFQGIFPTQGSNWHLLHCRQILYC